MQGNDGNDDGPKDGFSFPPDTDPQYTEKMRSYWDKAGRPQSADHYKWQGDPEFGELTDEDRSYRSHVGKLGWRIGLSAWQMREMEKGQYEYLRTQRDAAQAKAGSKAATDRAKAEIAKLEGEAIRRGYDPTHRHWPHAILEPLYRKAYGSRNIRQHGGRSPDDE